MGTDAVFAAAAAAWINDGVLVNAEGNSCMIKGDLRFSAA